MDPIGLSLYIYIYIYIYIYTCVCWERERERERGGEGKRIGGWGNKGDDLNKKPGRVWKFEHYPRSYL